MNKFTRIMLNGTAVLSFLFVTACSSTAPVTTKQAGSMSRESVSIVREGTVTSIKEVAIMGAKGRAGSTVGSIAGSILGSSIPVAGSLLGSMIGSAVGSEADKEFSKKKGLDITVQLATGEKVVVTQLAETSFKTGDKVQVIVTDNKARVAHLQTNS